MKNHFFLLFLSFLALSACNKDDDSITADPAPTKQYGEMELLVEICPTSACDTIILAAGAKVYLYKTEADRTEGADFLVEGSTAINGLYSNNTLCEHEYWGIIELPQPDGRQVNKYFKTPAGTRTNFVHTFRP